MLSKSTPPLLASLALGALFVESVQANGIYRNGIGARALSLGGAEVADASDPLGAMGSNPAGLGFQSKLGVSAGVTVALPDGDFSNSANSNSPIDDSPGFIPDFAIALPLGDLPFTIGIGVVPEAAMASEWTYVDAPGGLGGGVSYGSVDHESEILVLRSSLGIGWKISETLSVGASAGLIYNDNRLQAPYTFQSAPAVQGAKTLLDLQTDGFGVDGEFGVAWKPHPDWQFGLTYRLESRVESDGRAKGDISAQVPAFTQGDYRYDAEVINKFPQRASAGASWRFHPKFRAIAQVDWIDWSSAFDQLPVILSNGNNAELNAFAGSDAITDYVPLNWRDSWIGHLGFEYIYSEELRLRTGYSYGRSPVPDGTLTPLTAVIPEHTIAAGLNYAQERYSVDFGWQWNLPKERNVGTSDLLSGEYSNSNTEIGIHWIGLSSTFWF